MPHDKHVELTIPSLPEEDWKEIQTDFQGLTLQELCDYCYKIGWLAGKHDEMIHTREFLNSLRTYGKRKIRRTGSGNTKKKVSKNTTRRKRKKEFSD